MNYLLEIVDTLLFGLLFIQVTYLFIFALFSLRKSQTDYPRARKQHDFLVLFPAYKEDYVIEQAVDCFLKQNYTKEKYDILVVSDQMLPETNKQLQKYPILLLQTKAPLGSKAAALNYAIDHLEKEYDCIVIMDADNLAGTDFLERINEVYDFGVYAIQAHRKAKNKNTDVAILDAASEEINNAFFRKGHVNAGLPSALIGSGMAFDYKWFTENIKKISSVGEDKELEQLLMKQKIYVEYLDDIIILDEKVKNKNAFYNQRARWIYSQINALRKSIKDLPEIILTGNWWYLDKVFQWFMLPRVILLGVITLIASVSICISWVYSLKWWGILLLLFITFSLAIPDELVDDKFKHALKKIPILFILMFINLFRAKKGGERFLHTEHTKSE